MVGFSPDLLEPFDSERISLVTALPWSFYRSQYTYDGLIRGLEAIDDKRKSLLAALEDVTSQPYNPYS